ncbi:Gemin6 [Mucor lusitanicus]|uniref:AD domain-containing protein n=2 Tax=Mucor circinelloides f. lusitanicus TaxID=29924 RepID=A0A168HED1_MUCCL|nr:Gemin6 [Mucor lusitanicus]OAC98691.1 hypothetical protein MUCCIDRAFT_114932 [Mucor lusitanicus CBS 277.49]
MAELLYSKTSEQWLELLGHYTTVTLKNQKSITGYLYTIDPTSQHVVMYDSKDQRVVVVMSSSIRDLNVDSEDHVDLHIIDAALKYQQENRYTSEWLEKRRQALIQHLEKHRIPIQYQANEPVIHVLGCARVESPYAATSVVCDNALIRKRVRDIVLDLFNDATSNDGSRE